MIFLLIMLVSVYMLVYGALTTKCICDGKVWGIHIPPTQKQAAFKKKGKTFMIIGLIGVVISGMPLFGAWFSLLFEIPVLALLYFPVLIAVAVCAIFVCKKHAEKPELMEGANNSVLGELPFIQSAENHIENANSFIVSFEGIAFISNTNYCYAIERYENYQLGELNTADEVALVAGYFEQKYNHLFSSKADFERIPGQPGQRITSIGSGGINVAYTSGTKMQSNFRSYIFTRK
ncbi:MAG: hypothetical protein IJ275_00395 [Ruminococcus sp.]|nr:hypothetical protein [Ruminococcus sp.]